MIINWYGEGCFRIQTSGTVVLTDPFEAEVGLTPPRFKPDVVIRTITTLPFGPLGDYEATMILGAGEYEIRDIELRGFSLAEESSDKFIKTIFKMKAEELNIVFLGHISDMPLADVLEKLDVVDVLFMPVPGGHFISEEKAATLIRQLNPKVVIPSFFKVTGLKRSADSLSNFLKEFDTAGEPQEKITLKKKDLPVKTTIYVPKI